MTNLQDRLNYELPGQRAVVMIANVVANMRMHCCEDGASGSSCGSCNGGGSH